MNNKQVFMMGEMINIPLDPLELYKCATDGTN